MKISLKLKLRFKKQGRKKPQRNGENYKKFFSNLRKKKVSFVVDHMKELKHLNLLNERGKIIFIFLSNKEKKKFLFYLRRAKNNCENTLEFIKKNEFLIKKNE